MTATNKPETILFDAQTKDGIDRWQQITKLFLKNIKKFSKKWATLLC